MRINIHSISSAITNSSTTVYVYAKQEGVQFIKDIINQVLKDGGSDKTFDDMYEIKIEFDDDLYESFLDEVPPEYEEEVENLNWKESVEWAKKYLKEHPEETPEETWSGYPYPTHYELVAKDEGNVDLLNKINKIFDYEGFTDG